MPYQQTPRDSVPDTGWNPTHLGGLRGSDSSVLRVIFTSLKDYLRKYVNNQNQGARVFRNAVQGIANGAFGVFVDFNAESYDAGEWHSNTVNPSRVTIPAGAGGKYLIVAQTVYATNGVGLRLSSLSVNGVNVGFQSALGTNSGVFDLPLIMSSVRVLAPGDYVQVGVFQNSGGVLNIMAGADTTYLALHYLGPA